MQQFDYGGGCSRAQSLEAVMIQAVLFPSRMETFADLRCR